MSKNNNTIVQFILFGDVMTGYKQWYYNKNNKKIEFVKRLKKLGNVIVLKPNYVNFMGVSTKKNLNDYNRFYSTKKNLNDYYFTKDDLMFENYSKWVFDQIDQNIPYVAIGNEQGSHFAKHFCNKYSHKCMKLYILIDRNFTKESYERTFLSESNYEILRKIIGDKWENFKIPNITNNEINFLLKKIIKTKDDKYINLLNAICKGIIRSQYDKVKSINVNTMIYSDVEALTKEKLELNKTIMNNNKGKIFYNYIFRDDHFFIFHSIGNHILNEIYGFVKNYKIQRGGTLNNFHIAGSQGSGKTTLGKMLIDEFSDKIYVFDLDNLSDEFNKQDEIKEYQEYLDKFIEDHNDKPLVFVGLDAEACLGEMTGKGKIYDLKVNDENKYYIASSLDTLKQRFNRQVDKLYSRKEWFFKSWKEKPSLIQDKLFRFVDINKWAKNNSICDDIYIDRGYQVKDQSEIFTDIQIKINSIV